MTSTTALPEMDNTVSLEQTPSPARRTAEGEPPPFSVIFKQLTVKVVLPFLAVLLALWNLFVYFCMAVINPRNDFGRAFYSALLFVNGQDMYASNRATPVILDNESIILLWNLNPPHSHFLLLPLVWFSADVALAVWCVANTLCGLVALWLIVRELKLQLTDTQRKLAVIFLMAFIGTSTAIITAHLSGVMFLFLTLCWLSARRGRWTTAGVWLGVALSIKPFLLFLVPYFLWNRRWKASAAIAATAVACFAIGLLVFGVENHLSWLEKLRTADTWAWLPINGSLRGMLTRSFTQNLDYTAVVDLGESTVKWIWLGIGIPFGLLTFAAAGTDRSPRGVDRAFAILLVGSLFLSPLGWAYYFWLPLGPIVALACDWQRELKLQSNCSSYLWRRRFLIAALPGLVLPIQVVLVFHQVGAWTLTLGSLYCWSLLLLWIALMIDGWLHWRRAGRPAVAQLA
jgi:hypothetical protein